MQILNGGVGIAYRTSENPMPRSGKLKYQDKILQIEFGPGGGATEPGEEGVLASKPFELNKFSEVKCRDYADGLSFDFGLILTEKSGGLRHSFIFQKLEDRDLFHHEIQKVITQVMRRVQASKRNEDEKHTEKAQQRVISKVTVQEPPPVGTICSIKLELDPPPEKEEVVRKLKEAGIEDETRHLFEVSGKIQLLLPIKDKKENKDDRFKCKDEVAAFVKMHNIVSTEGTSLYRLVKALLSRRQVKEQAEEVMEQIDKLHFDEHAKNVAVLPQTEGQQLQVNDDLEKLKLHLPRRLGSAGLGTELVTAMLVHNIEKMKAINTITSHHRFSEHSEKNSTGWRASARAKSGSPGFRR